MDQKRDILIIDRVMSHQLTYFFLSLFGLPKNSWAGNGDSDVDLGKHHVGRCLNCLNFYIVVHCTWERVTGNPVISYKHGMSINDCPMSTQ